MTQIDQVYRCEICGNIVKVLENGGGELVCCGQPMILENEKYAQENPGANKEEETNNSEANFTENQETEEVAPNEEAETNSEE